MRKLYYNVISNYLQTTCHPTTCHQTLCQLDGGLQSTVAEFGTALPATTAANDGCRVVVLVGKNTGGTMVEMCTHAWASDSRCNKGSPTAPSITVMLVVHGGVATVGAGGAPAATSA